MYPELLEIHGFVITSFGALVALGALAGLWLFGRELARSGLPEGARDAALMGVIAGLLGAKLFWVAEHAGEEPFWSLVTSRGGLTWFGGLVAGVGAGLIVFLVRKYPLVPTLAAATPALALGHLIGRIGCFLVGDDYGTPSDLPWAVAFPKGLPPTLERVHPTQLYEAACLAVLTWLLLRWRRHRTPDHIVLGRYLVLTAAVRFLIEFIRINERVALGLTTAQWMALALMLLGTWIIVFYRGRRRTTSEGRSSWSSSAAARSSRRMNSAR
jgi:phosphatidylglycerol---prolipoprotein diacylglyceryl transferase